MSELRKAMMIMYSNDLWELFDEYDEYEQKFVIADDAKLRVLTESHFGGSNAMQMTVVAHEVWRELAQRGMNYTLG